MTRMRRVGRQQFNSQAADFRRLIKRDSPAFRREWKKRVLRWLYEIHRRARNWSKGTDFRNAETAEGLTELGRMQVFAVVARADRFIAACGERCEDMVGDETRSVLRAECVKVVARVVDRQLNRMIYHKSYCGVKHLHK